MENIDERERDIQSLCNSILELSSVNTGDFGLGAECPFCFAQCPWGTSLNDMIHKDNCAVLIAKDLKTRIKI